MSNPHIQATGLDRATESQPRSKAPPRGAKILCISLTPIYRDARVLRQIGLLAQLGEVTTIGFGEKPENATHHIRVPDGLSTLPQTVTGVAKLALRASRAAERSAPAAKWVLENVAERGRWNLVVANDARVLDLGFALAAGKPVWADMHEWAPEERTHVTSWRLLVAPQMRHLCKKYLPQAALVTTVSNGIVDLYREHFEVSPLLMTNAGPLQSLSPVPVLPGKIRCVHSGAAIGGRGLETMVKVFHEDLPQQFELDLYLVPGGDKGAHLKELRNIASGDPRIKFHDPVAPSDLPAILNQYDLGVFWIPPTHTNARLTLPNKFFDYVQARLGIAIGPSSEMVNELSRSQLGVVASSFEADDLAASIAHLTTKEIEEFKAAADQSAERLSFDRQVEVVRERLYELLSQE